MQGEWGGKAHGRAMDGTSCRQSRLAYPVFCTCDLLHDECTYADEVSGVLLSEMMNHAFVICCMMNAHMLVSFLVFSRVIW